MFSTIWVLTAVWLQHQVPREVGEVECWLKNVCGFEEVNKILIWAGWLYSLKIEKYKWKISEKNISFA